jgi:hypothetical protein
MSSKSGKFDAGYLQFYLDGAKNDAEKRERQTEAALVMHELSPVSMVFSSVRLMLAWVVYFFVLLLTFNGPVVLVSNGTTALLLAVIVYSATLALGVISGQPSIPSFELYIMRPLWTWLRAREGWKFYFAWRDLMYSLFWELGIGLFLAWAMQRAVSAINPFADMTIPQNVLVTSTVYASVLLFCSVVTCLFMWFDVLGPGDKDGVWLPRSVASSDLARAWADRHFAAMWASAKFLFLYLVTGQAFPVDPLYIFATYTQHTPDDDTDGTNYHFLFEWLLGTSLVTTFVLFLMNFGISDWTLMLFDGIIRWRGKRRRRRGYFGRGSGKSGWWGGGKGKRKGDDNDDDDDEDEDNDDDDEDDN